jgi:DNA mismatch repair protein MutH
MQSGGVVTMIKEGKIWLANNDKGENIYLLPKMANRHGLVRGYGYR